MDTLLKNKEYKDELKRKKLSDKVQVKIEKGKVQSRKKTEKIISGNVGTKHRIASYSKVDNKVKTLSQGKIIPKKRKKTKTRGQLVKELDAIFSRYIRMRDADNYGMCKCITCGAKVHRKNIQDGHFITRGNYKYRRDENNNFSQCMPCNIYKSGNYIAYTLVMIGKYGQEKVKEMQEDKELVKISTPQIRDMIEHYKKEVSKYEEMIQLEQDKYGI